jgi:alpha-L-fucosidase
MRNGANRVLLTRREWLAGLTAAGCLHAAPGEARPSERQLRWHELETYAFLHFTINTFTDKEWGYGDEDPNLFAPSGFDADAIVEPLKTARLKGVILTAKHHDGFCLWPTRTTEHCVRSARWRQGKGDVVGEIARAAAGQGLKFGVYLSPWDRNHAAYGGPQYVQVYRQQLRELLLEYGPVFEVWFDGANGGDGYYGGAREKRTIERRTYYDWAGTWEIVRELQPGAVIFSDVGPDVRWVGNEKGIAGETCWATYEPAGENGDEPAPGYTRYREGETGHRFARQWMPAECDVSIRPGWFWHEKENDRVKSGRDLLELYYRSVGRGASLLLNVPPERRGCLHENDVRSLQEFGRLVQGSFRTNLASRAALSRDGREWTVDVRAPREFNLIRLREDIRDGQQVDEFALDAWQDGGWRRIATGTSIGACRIAKLETRQRARRLRLRIEKSSGPVRLRELGVYLEQT